MDRHGRHVFRGQPLHEHETHGGVIGPTAWSAVVIGALPAGAFGYPLLTEKP